jgi:hypothetical protein
MENLYFAVIPAQAGIQWLQVLRDPRRSLPPQSLGGGGDDGKLVFFDTLENGNPGGEAGREAIPAKDIARSHR